MNEYDSLRVQRILHSQGYALTSDMALADVIFLNTCSVREKAEQKVHSFLGRLRRMKAERPGAQDHCGRVRCPTTRASSSWNGSNTWTWCWEHRGISAIAEILETIQETSDRLAHLPEEEAPRHSCEQHATPVPGAVAVIAPVTIMQGCDNYCTYCIVPHVRGRERSRPVKEILHEIQSLTASGVREVLLLGQNVNSYGRGLGEKTNFVDLLHRIQEETDVRRLRFTTSHPKDLTARVDPVLRRSALPLQTPALAGASGI